MKIEPSTPPHPSKNFFFSFFYYSLMLSIDVLPVSCLFLLVTCHCIFSNQVYTDGDATFLRSHSVASLKISLEGLFLSLMSSSSESEPSSWRWSFSTSSMALTHHTTL